MKNAAIALVVLIGSWAVVMGMLTDPAWRIQVENRSSEPIELWTGFVYDGKDVRHLESIPALESGEQARFVLFFSQKQVRRKYRIGAAKAYSNERPTLWIDFSYDEMEALSRGERMLVVSGSDGELEIRVRKPATPPTVDERNHVP